MAVFSLKKKQCALFMCTIDTNFHGSLKISEKS